jgi:hypothetical protein
MATPLYVVTLAALVLLSLAVPGLVWWSALAAVVATALWYYFRLRDAELDRRGDGVAELEGDALGPRRGTDVDE